MEELEDKLVAEYIGKNAEQFEKNINWVAAVTGELIGPVWFFYRKSYLIGFLFIILTFVVGMIASSLNIEKAYILMGIIYLFATNKIYLWDVRRKVKKLITNNKDLSEEQLIVVARVKGGTSPVAATIYTAVVVGLILLMIVLVWSAFIALANN